MNCRNFLIQVILLNLQMPFLHIIVAVAALLRVLKLAEEQLPPPIEERGVGGMR